MSPDFKEWEFAMFDAILSALFDKCNCSLVKLLQITKGRKLCLSLTINETSSLISGGTQHSQMQLIYMNSTRDFVL